MKIGRKKMSIKKAIELVGIYYGKALTLKYVHKKVAWALYQVWKIADKEKENEQVIIDN